MLFDEPDFSELYGLTPDVVPSHAGLKTLAESLGEGIHMNPVMPDKIEVEFGSWLAAIIRSKQQPVGLLWLAFSKNIMLTENQQIGLVTLMDGITIIAMSIRSEAHQQKLSRNQSEFMRIVSHDLRSPLTAMHGFASMLEMVGELNEKQDYFVEKILSGIAQMTSLVENFQDAGRFDPETGFYEMQRAPCDLTEIVHRIMGNHLLPAEKQELTLKAKISDDIPIINADVNMLERAITNLVDNAIKYTPNGHGVEIGLSLKNEHIIISVTDNGLGISEENRKMLFERHVRIPRREHKKVKGSGLGLFIVRSVAQRHGGRAWVESVEGEGTTFFISIPLDGDNMLVGDSVSS